jgi:flagellar motor protein MotB
MSDEHGKKHGSGGHGGGHGGSHGGPHGGGAHEEHEGAPEWLISFADNVALMMGFFVVLLAMNMKPAPPPAAAASTPGDDQTDSEQVQSGSPEMLDWAISLREAFNNPVRGNDPRDAILYQRLQQRRAQAELKKDHNEGADRAFRTLRKSDYFGLGGTLEFAFNSDELDTAARALLENILVNRRGLQNVIEVRGHASAAEAHSLPDRGMDLSYRRAKAVADELARQGIEWKRIRITAAGDADRVIQKTYDNAGHKSNQRVEIIDTERSATEPGSTPPASPNATQPTEAAAAATGVSASPKAGGPVAQH